MERIRVRNMESYNGNFVANQFIIEMDGKRIFQSYNSVIAVIEYGRVTLDKYYWNYSKTTGKYRNIFLGEGIEETRRKIHEGIYHLENLN